MRSDVEKALNLIAAGSADFNAVLKHAVEIFRMKFSFFVQNICVMDSLFESSFASIADSGKAFSRCGKCRRYMKYIQTKPARLHCTQCDDTYTLPKDGTVRWVAANIWTFSSEEAGMIWIFLLKCFLDHTKSSDVHWMISSCLHFRVVRKVDRIPYALTAMPIHLSKGCQTMLDVTRACIQLVPTQWIHLVFQCVMNAIEVFWFWTLPLAQRNGNWAAIHAMSSSTFSIKHQKSPLARVNSAMNARLS